MEYFYLGERTVQDRMWSYPHNFDMVYVSNPPLKTNHYGFVDAEFYYTGDAEDIQRSKKQITFAALAGVNLGAVATAIEGMK